MYFNPLFRIPYCRLYKSWLMRNLKVLFICGHQHFKRELQQHVMTLSNLLAQKTNLRLFCRLTLHSSTIHLQLPFHPIQATSNWTFMRKFNRLVSYLYSPFLVILLSVQLCFFFVRHVFLYCVCSTPQEVWMRILNLLLFMINIAEIIQIIAASDNSSFLICFDPLQYS